MLAEGHVKMRQANLTRDEPPQIADKATPAEGPRRKAKFPKSPKFLRKGRC